MISEKNNKRKIVNDPVYGFINIPNEGIFDLLEHKYVQRLRRIKQLGLSNFVYPGAEHTRFSHALGAMHLMNHALDVLRQKDIEITKDEYNSSLEAILLHDLGHSPISHALEHSFLRETHEEISLMLMKKMKLSPHTIDIFSNNYHKRFLHQLVSSQLDCDRLDYLTRDSFFTGVSEGVIGTERIIKMMIEKNDEIVIEQKGIYSIEKFIISRRLMYWQVYLHKTVIAADSLLVSILNRAKYLVENSRTFSLTPAMNFFINNPKSIEDKDLALEIFSQLDDNDIWASVRVWAEDKDKILSYLSSCLLNRRLGKVLIQNNPFSQEDIEKYIGKYLNKGFSKLEVQTYFIHSDELKNKAYSFLDEKINILFKNGEVKEICDASDQLDKVFLSKEIKKYFLYQMPI